jgi:hypothetical protein
MHSLDIIIERNIKATARAHAHAQLDGDPLKCSKAYTEIHYGTPPYHPIRHVARAVYAVEHARALHEEA